MQVATLATEGLTWWGIANGLGAHTQELDPYELSVQFKVIQTVLKGKDHRINQLTPAS